MSHVELEYYSNESRGVRILFKWVTCLCKNMSVSYTPTGISYDLSCEKSYSDILLYYVYYRSIVLDEWRHVAARTSCRALGFYQWTSTVPYTYFRDPYYIYYEISFYQWTNVQRAYVQRDYARRVTLDVLLTRYRALRLRIHILNATLVYVRLQLAGNFCVNIDLILLWVKVFMTWEKRLIHACFGVYRDISVSWLLVWIKTRGLR